ncbi:hypothetical protein [Dendronalium sp. ChiSLP03b]|uniref:hypothetical protein n=1 Tax=Dendronalium sp. ChiSLP03b TaxID=3075381 RepID=UPI002AD3B478|nr:hypothetical protein [Dendronalium sp. ChiSLP03b]MDZ8209186.1 hypothetical protein [Dendronalium sp. ChiSLP03b]
MKIIKLILLACPVFLASILLIANPAKALSIKSAPATQAIAVVSTQQTTDLAAPKLTLASNPIGDGLGCNCASCVQAKLQMLQGKLPSVGF